MRAASSAEVTGAISQLGIEKIGILQDLLAQDSDLREDASEVGHRSYVASTWHLNLGWLMWNEEGSGEGVLVGGAVA